MKLELQPLVATIQRVINRAGHPLPSREIREQVNAPENDVLLRSSTGTTTPISIQALVRKLQEMDENNLLEVTDAAGNLVPQGQRRGRKIWYNTANDEVDATYEWVRDYQRGVDIPLDGDLRELAARRRAERWQRVSEMIAEHRHCEYDAASRLMTCGAPVPAMERSTSDVGTAHLTEILRASEMGGAF